MNVEAVHRRYDFNYFGPNLDLLVDAATAWCASHGCSLQVVPLLRGARLQVSGPEGAISEAIREVRTWIRSAR